MSAFLFRAWSTLSFVSSRTKHWNWWMIQGSYFPVQDLVYSHCYSEDQVLKIFLSVVVPSYSELSLLSLYLRTKYQISHTAGRLFPVAVLSPASRNSSHLSHWGCSQAVQVPLISSAQKHYCHTTCPLDITLKWYQNTVCSPSGQDWPNLSFRLGMPLAEVPVNCSPGCKDECECKSDPWHRVLLPVLCYTATRLLLLQNMSDPWHSVQLLVLCFYLLEWFWSGGFAVGGNSGNTAKLHLWWRVQSLFWPSACFWGDANLYLSTTFCIRLNSSKIHSSNNHIATCAAPFILLHSPQLQDTVHLSASSASHSTPSQLWVFHKLHTQSMCALLLQTLDPSGSNDPITEIPWIFTNLFMIPLFVVIFNELLNLNKVMKWTL